MTKIQMRMVNRTLTRILTRMEMRILMKMVMLILNLRLNQKVMTIPTKTEMRIPMLKAKAMQTGSQIRMKILRATMMVIQMPTDLQRR